MAVEVATCVIVRWKESCHDSYWPGWHARQLSLVA